MFLGQVPAHAAPISVDGSSKVMVLYGYSMDLNKQGITSIHPLLNDILSSFVSVLKDKVRDIEYFSDHKLDTRFELAAIPKEEDKRPAAIERLLRDESYTHLVTANVTMISEDKGVGVILMQVAAVKNGRPHDFEVMERVTVEKPLKGKIDPIRNRLVAEFTEKFLGVTAKKTVNIGCIERESPAAPDRLNEMEQNQWDLEKELSPRVTNQLIRLYHRRIQNLRPLQKEGAYEFESGKCKRGERDLTNVYPDYDISGRVGVRDGTDGRDLVKVDIKVIQPDDCVRFILIPEDFKRSWYSEIRKFSIRFSEEILPEKYEPEWVTLETKPCGR
jgi:hypothetical protein